MEGKKAEHSLSIYTLNNSCNSIECQNFKCLNMVINNFTGNVEGDDMRTHKSASNVFDYFYHEILTCSRSPLTRAAPLTVSPV